MTKVVIADDEPHLRRHLAKLLQDHWPVEDMGELDLAGQAGDGAEAMELIQNLTPAVAFIDIRMPELSGLEVARSVSQQLGPNAPLMVFVTAFEDHAVEAFEAAAVDYLLKPVMPRRLQSCLQRLARQLKASQSEGGPAADSAEQKLIDLLKRLPQEERPQPLQWLRAGYGDETEMVAVADVVYFKAEHKYVSAFTQDRQHILRLSIKELVQQLDRDRFWQIHRSLIVNVAQIQRAKKDLRGRYQLCLRDRKETLRTSTAYAHLFRSM